MIPKQHGRLNKFLLPAIMVSLLSCSGGDDENEVEQFEPVSFEASASANAVLQNEAVTFTDASTKVHTRLWTFEGGDPALSTEANVTVAYKTGGEFKAILKVTFIDNTSKTQEFPIAVEGLPDEHNDPVITGATYGVTSEHSNVTPGTAIWYINSNAFINKEHDGEPFEGESARSFIVDGTGPGADHTWAMGIIQAKDGVRVDLSQFANGYLNLALKSTSTGALRIRIRGTGLDASKHLTAAGADYGFVRDGQWHMISIPMADILAAIPEANRADALKQVADLLILRSGDGLNITTVNNYNFDVDNVYYSENLPEY